MRLPARLYIASVIVTGLALTVVAVFNWQTAHPGQFAAYAVVTLIAAAFKVRLPGITGTISPSYVFVLLSMLDLSYPQTVVLACAAIVVQTYWKAKRRPRLVQVVFNMSSMTIAVTVGTGIYGIMPSDGPLWPVSVAVASTSYFLTNTISVAAVLALTENKRVDKLWRECYFWTFPYYLIGGAGAAAISVWNQRVGWETAVLALPVAYAVFRSYRLYLERLESQRNHAEEIAALHLRTIEALALAIEAKDDTTHEHLQRVQTYAISLGKRMGLDETELRALHAASILHDIGKLAVPEHIISKPGKLTPEEFEKMKIHPTVGAEILERVQFPYPVVPIVRYHHEKWDGSGYPEGLSGEQIPIGARILTVVDCLDALASDRQYRPALPLDQAMAMIVSEAGHSFDPEAVKVLHQNYITWEKEARSNSPRHEQKLSKDVRIGNGRQPGAGLQTESGTDGQQQPEFLVSIAAARQEAQALYELTQSLGSSLNLPETLSVLDNRLRNLIPYDAMAVYVREDDRLIATYACGENAKLFQSLTIPIGQGLSGWVAATGQPIINGNPSVEAGYLNDSSKFSKLRSAMAVPLDGPSGPIGVLALYRLERDAFNRDHLRILLAINPKLSLTIHNALEYQEVAISATADGLTALPNAKSLFLHLHGEVAAVQRDGRSLAVLVCDLDGFKRVNDRFGHLEGNRVLKLVATGMRSICRETDYVARMGGDEYVLVLPDLRPSDVEALYPRLEKVAVGAGLEVCGEPAVNISVGAAFCPDDGDNAEVLLAEADRRMYAVKQAHKNRATDSPSALPLEALANALRIAGTLRAPDGLAT
jgi:diguanylate cyclase (GGDEF)-like protein/putative nucleotidyltransferase with HDIG domain